MELFPDATECCDNTFAEKSSLVNGQIDMACQENGIKKVAKEQDSDSEVFDNEIVNKVKKLSLLLIYE